MRFSCCNFVFHLIFALLAGLLVPSGLCQHYCCNSSEEVEKATSQCAETTLATQTRVCQSGKQQDYKTTQIVEPTSQCWTDFQRSLYSSLESSHNGTKKLKADERTFLEMPTMQNSQQRGHRMVPVVLEALDGHDGCQLRGPSLSSARRRLSSKGTQKRCLGISTDAQLARRSVVAPSSSNSQEIEKRIKKGKSEEEERGRARQRVQELPLCHFFSFTLFEHRNLRSSTDAYTVDCQGQRAEGDADYWERAPSQCRGHRGYQGFLPGWQRHAGKDEGTSGQVRNDLTKGDGQGYGANLDYAGNHAGEPESAQRSQNQPQASMVEEPTGDDGYLGRPYQILHLATGGIFEDDFECNNRDRDHQDVAGHPLKAGGRGIAQEGRPGRNPRRTSWGNGGEGGQKEANVCHENMYSTGHRRVRFGRDQLRRGGQGRGSGTWGWAQKTWQRCTTLVILGSSVVCPRNASCVPELPPRRVHFADEVVEELLHHDIVTWDGLATTPPPLNCLNLFSNGFHSILRQDDCIFDFQAGAQAMDLAFDLLREQTDDILEDFRVSMSRRNSHMAPLSLSEAVLSREASPHHQQNFEGPWPRRQSWAEPIDIPGYPLEGRPFIDNMPIWVQQLQQGIFTDQAVVEQREEGPVLCMMTWYLHGNYQRTCSMPRVVQLDVYYEYWETTIREAWRDVMDAASELEVFIVYPEPPRTTGRTHSGHLIVVQEQHHHDKAFLLSAFFRDYRDNKMLQRAMFTERAVTANDIQRLSDQQHLCRQYGCTIFYDEEILDDNWHWLHDGSSIVQYVEAHRGGPRRTWSGEFAHDQGVDSDASSLLATKQTDPLVTFLDRSAYTIHKFRTKISSGERIRAKHSDPQSDVITLMGRNPVIVRQQEPNDLDLQQFIEPEDVPDHMLPGRWFTAIVYRMGKPDTITRISSGDLAHLINQVAAALTITPQQLIELHEVRHPPQDLEQVFDYIWAAHCIEDVPQGARGKLVLTDIEFCSNLPILETDTVRRLRMIVTPTTRTTLLKALGLQPFCQQAPCLIKLNNHFIHDTGPVPLAHGDFLHIIVGPLNDEQCVNTRLAAAALHMGFNRDDLFNNDQLAEQVDEERFPNPETYLDVLPFDESGHHVELMQRHAEVLWRPTHIGSPHQCRNDGELQETLQALHAMQNATQEAADQVLRDALAAERPIIRDLHGYYLRDALPWEGRRWIKALVWYISHATCRICARPRAAWLHDDFTLWYDTIKATWSDRIDESEGVTMLIATPQPENDAGQEAIHIMLIQHDDLPEEGAAIVTLRDEGYRAGLREHQAIVLPLRITHEILLTVANRLRICLSSPLAIRCTTRFGVFDVTHEPMRGRAGHTYQVDIRRPPTPQDTMSFPTTILPGAPPFVRTLHATILARQMAQPDETVNLRVMTWFLNHHTSTTCLYGREVDLPPQPNLWLVAILQAWPDLYLMQFPVDAYVVTPTPQDTQWMGGEQYHIILHQQERPGFISVMTTTYDGSRGEHDPYGLHRAIVMPNHCHRQGFLQKLELWDWCEGTQVDRRCQVHYGSLLVDDNAGMFGNHGLAFKVTLPQVDVELWDDTPEGEDEYEDNNLLQTNTQPITNFQHFGSDGKKGKQHAHPTCCRLEDDPAEPVRQAAEQNAQAARQQTQMILNVLPRGLSDLWLQHAGALETPIVAEDTFGVITWFLHAHTARRCNIPRGVHLPSDPMAWQQILIQSWQDEYDHAGAVEFHLVRPQPYDMEQGFIAHLIIVQADNYIDAGILFTVYDNAVRDNRASRFAALASRRLHHDEVLHHADSDRLCRMEGVVCQTWVGWDDVTNWPFFYGSHGMGITLSIIRPLASFPQAEDPWRDFEVENEDNINLFQIKAQPISIHQHLEIAGDFRSGMKDNTVRLNLNPAVKALYQMDENFILPTFDVVEALPPDTPWMPCCSDWIHQPWFEYNEQIFDLVVYFDGSFVMEQNRIGYAAAAFVQTFSGWKFAGAVSGGSSADSTGAYTAELKAVIIALKLSHDILRCIQNLNAEPPTWSIIYDSLTVGKQACGLWKAHQNPQLCKTARGLCRLIEKQFTVYGEFLHTSSHCGDPGNEIVDVIAGQAARTQPLQEWEPFFDIINQKEWVEGIAWAWILFDDRWLTHMKDHHLTFPAKPITKPGIEVLPDFTGIQTPSQCISVQLMLLSCNVLTLKNSNKGIDAMTGVAGPSRLETILHQVWQAGVHIFGLQETRYRRHLSVHDSRYHLISSPATPQGHLGLLCGISKEYPIATTDNGKPVFVHENDYSIIEARPRSLIIRLAAGKFRCIIVVAHAPHNGAEHMEIQNFWEDLSASIPRKYTQWPRLLFADANTRVGDETSDSIGDHHASQGCEKSAAFVQFVQREGLWLPSTFTHNHEGDSGTWRHSRGSWSRIDFLGVPLQWTPHECQSWVSDEVDVSLQKEDHKAVMVHFKTQIECPSHFTHKPRPKVKEDCIDPDMLAYMGWFTPVDVNTDVHTHAHSLQEQLLQQTSRRPDDVYDQKPLKETMSSYTWELVQEKRWWRNQLASWQRGQNSTILGACFLGWKQVVTTKSESAGANTLWPKRTHDNQCHLVASNMEPNTKCRRQPTSGGPEQSDFEKDLAILGDRQIVERRGLQDGTFVVHTWYLDHDRFPTQAPDRIIHLQPSEASRWREQLLNRWADIAIPTELAFFYLVRPSPANDVEGDHIHVLIVQNAKEDTVSILATIEYPGPAIGFRQRLALAHSRMTNTAEVMEAVRCEQIASSRQFHCGHVLLDDAHLPTQWDPNRIYLIENGNHLIVEVQFIPPAQSDEDGEPSQTVSSTISFELSEAPDESRSSHAGDRPTASQPTPPNEEHDERVEFAGLQRDLKDYDHKIAMALNMFRNLGRRVTKATRADDLQFFTDILQTPAEFLEPGQVQRFWASLRRAIPKYKVRRQQFNPMRIEALEDEWSHYFQELEAGYPSTADDLIQRCHHDQMRKVTEVDLFCIDEIPSILELEDEFRLTQGRKATGFDPMPSDIFRRNAPQMADLFHPLLVKMMIWQMEPVSSKGGPLAMIPKRAHANQVAHYRGIMLLPTFAKRIHAIIRKRIIAPFAHHRLPGQLGGMPHQQVAFGSQALQAYGRIMDSYGLSCGIVFVDLSNAFHRLIRQMVSGVDIPEEAIAVIQTLVNQGFKKEDLEAALEIPSVLADLGLPRSLVRMLQDIHHCTWFVVGDQGKLSITRKGTRPGSPLADLIFHILMSDVMREFAAWTTQCKEYQEILTQVGIEGDPVIWSDDIAIPWATATGSELPTALRNIVMKLDDLFSRRGFLLNMSKGKTSVVATFRGQGAAALRAQYQLSDIPGDTVQIRGEDVHLHYVSQYKHLGCIFSSKHDLDCELRARIGQASAAFAELSRPILCNRHLPPRLRLQLFQTFVCTRLYFGMGTWRMLSKRQVQRLRGVICRMAKRILHLKPEEPISLEVIAQKYQVTYLEPRPRLALERLLYAHKLWWRGPAFLQHLLLLEDSITSQSWIAGLKADLEWLKSLETLPVEIDGPNGLSDLIDYWQAGGQEWRRCVKRAWKRYHQQETMMVEVKNFTNEVFDALREAGATFKGNSLTDDEEAVLHPCHCGRTFTTAVGLATHQRKVHQQFSIERPMLAGATCPHCLKFCWTTARLQQHLAYISRKTGENACFQALSKRGYRADYQREPLATLPTGFHRVESIPALGPRMETYDSRQREHEADLNLEATLVQELRDFVEPEDVVHRSAQCKQELTDITMFAFHEYVMDSFDVEALQTLPDNWLAYLSSFDPDLHPWLEVIMMEWGQDVLPDVLAGLEDGEAEKVIDTLFADCVEDFPRVQCMRRLAHCRTRIRRCLEREQGAVPHRPIRLGDANDKERFDSAQTICNRFSEQEQWLMDLRTFEWEDLPPDQALPQWTWTPSITTYFVVHLFSGRRRKHDLHFELHRLAEAAGINVVVLSMDTAISLEYGNLDKDSTGWKHLTTLYREGRVAATMCGSPCETFSEARFHRPENLPEGHADRWPRPLRSWARLFGLEGLSFRELRQLRLGSLFYLQGILTLVWSLVHGGLYLSEHPWMPADASRPSIWTSPLVQLLRHHPDVQLHCVQQWQWGCSVRKPTGLLALRLPWLKKSMYKRACPDAAPPTDTAIGRDDTGEFKTHKHKEYPGPFCTALAGALVDELVVKHRKGATCAHMAPLSDSLRVWVQQAVEACATIRADAQILPDYQGG